MSTAPEMIRLTTRISKEVNDWLDEKSRKTGVPKSTWIYLALEQYIKQDQVTNELPKFMKQLEEFQRLTENQILQQAPEGSERSGDSLKD